MLCYTYDQYAISVFAVAVKSQQNITCYVAANCDISQSSETILSDDSVSVCCNYPSAGVRSRGYSYQFYGQERCVPCPKG